MTHLSYPLSVLAKAVAYRNLSSASLHVGLSQPQLSRMIAKLESELGMELLDRQVKRKSSWTINAHRLAEVFQANQKRLDHSLRALAAGHRVRHVHIGTLEGLADAAIGFSKILFDEGGIELVMLDVFDRNELEAKFLAGDLDLILNTRIPSHSKARYQKVCGYQSLDIIEKGQAFTLYSVFEYNIRAKPKRVPDEKTLVSNSLLVRRTWMEKFGGHGTLPSRLFDQSQPGFDEVILIGGDWLDPHIWESLAGSH